MYKEGGDQPADAIAFISKIQEEIATFDDIEEDSFSHIKTIQYGGPDPAPDIPTDDGGTHEARTTGEHTKPVRLTEHYPEPIRRVPRTGPSSSLPQPQEGTRRECNP